MAQRTPSQTIGPVFHEALRGGDGGQIRFAEAGERLLVTGRLTDGDGAAVGDALIESWQLSPAGRTPAPAEGAAKPHGFGRVETAPDGSFRIETLLPAASAPSLEIAVFARGFLKALRARVYFCAEERARAEPTLKALAASPRLKTLIARRDGATGRFRWDVRLQGEGETVFFSFEP